MAESRHRWIDDNSDDYDSSEEEIETQPCSISPMRRESISLPTPPDASFAIDCLIKQIELTPPPYQFLLIGVPYKLNSAKKLAKEVFGGELPSEVELKILYRGNTFTGKAILKTPQKDVAKDLARIHGRKLTNRVLSVEVFRELPQRTPDLARRPVSLKIVAATSQHKEGDEAQTKDKHTEVVPQAEEIKREISDESSLPQSPESSVRAPTRSRAPRFRARK